jgi:hypothetical protein
MRRVPVLFLLFFPVVILPLAGPLSAQSQQQTDAHTLLNRIPPPPPANDDHRVLELKAQGFGDPILIARIDASDWTFRLTDADLVSLQKSGLSAQVIAQMIDHMSINIAAVVIDDKRVAMVTLDQATTGGRLMNNLTGDITPLTQNAYLDGSLAATIATAMPDIKITLPKDDSIRNYILVQMKRHQDRRELVVDTGSGISNSHAGIQQSAIVKTSVVSRGGHAFQLLPEQMLKPGAYMVYIVGSADEKRDIYGKGFDFTVIE